MWVQRQALACQVRSNSRRRRLLQSGGMDIYDEETGECNGYFLNDECTAYSICADHQYMSVMGDNTTITRVAIGNIVDWVWRTKRCS